MKCPGFAPLLLLLCVLVACEKGAVVPAPAAPPSLLEARRGFVTKLIRREATGEPAELPPPGIFRMVHYPSPAGALAAYVGLPPADGAKHPAILWLVGGFSNSISSIAWTPGPPDNDQSATAFREAGIVMMYPSLRGGNSNPGVKEGFYGEVDDVLAALDYLSHVEGVDPERLYLGGHSTGGTLGLLVAACRPPHLRAAFCFGPVEDVAGYGAEILPFDPRDARECRLRAPGAWLGAIAVPCHVIEGAGGRRSNIDSLRQMAKAPHPANVFFHAIPGVDHFGTLAPITRLLARKIAEDRGTSPGFALDDAELRAAIPVR